MPKQQADWTCPSCGAVMAEVPFAYRCPKCKTLTQKPGIDYGNAMDADTNVHPFDDFRRGVVEALGLDYGTPDMWATRYPTDAEIIKWVATEHLRVTRMHDGHHTDMTGFCPDCGMYGKGKPDGG